MDIKYIIDNNDNSLTEQFVNGGLSATTLSATTITLTSNPVPGHVLTSDSNGNGGWSSPSDGFTHQIGEYVSDEGGVIYHKEKSGATQIYHILSLSDLDQSNWGFNSYNIESNSRWNGEENTDKINQYIPNLQTQASNLVSEYQTEQSQYETDVSDIDQQIYTIQQQIAFINQEYGSGEGPPTDPTILTQLQQLQNDLDQLEEDRDQLISDFSQYQENYNTQLQQLSNLIQDVQQSVQSGCAGISARNYNGSGKSDWYLPSIAELVKIWNNQYEVSKGLEEAIGTWLTPDFYWSSAESDSALALALDFDSGSISYRNKVSIYDVRVVRQFSI